ncbi:MobF family relaxase [uncultured Erythrobacter sp.]|uniref:MobF family relaxase n=1 Tax=uncultured Erythrobacter sp. TaxID=263913 RepID=UPI00263074F1|nr:MobF family relaxase [uncultured Erythrobacter sp.]
MMSLGKVASSGAAEYYSRDNYFSVEVGTDLSRWEGTGARMLGLDGKVDVAEFERILEGKLPDGSELGAARGEHRPGLDLTFSAPKSVSLIALLGKDERVIEAFRASVSQTISWAEKNLAQAKVWRDGRQVTENTGNLLVASFLHDVSRELDPQLHLHAVLKNATFASDGKWHALKNDQIYQHQRTLGAVHNAYLRQGLEKLGYETAAAKNPVLGEFEIKGISREQIEAFSDRRAQILGSLEKDDRSSPREREIAALATRREKEPDMDRKEREKVWEAKATTVGLNLQPIIAAAVERSVRGETFWSRLIEGVRGIHNKGLAIAAAMGLTPRSGDELMPERKGALVPTAFAAAQAVASAARDLGENEAGFERLDLVRAALERRGPINVDIVEERIAYLQDKGRLLGNERMVTSASMLALEQRAGNEIETGRGAVAAFADRPSAALQVQQKAVDLGMRPLNSGQLRAAVDVLSGQDRVHLVQGGAGTGKSASLIPVASLLREQGKQVHALAIATRTAREFGEKLGVGGKSVAAFLARHRGVLDGPTTSEQAANSAKELHGAWIMVDETSLVGTEQFEKLVRLANLAGAERLVMIGDTRQLQAIAAGKPFEQAQKRGTPTSAVTENLRAASPQMKEVADALNREDLPGAFAALKDRTLELPRHEGVETAAAFWVGKPPEEREQTLLLTMSRAMRSALNQSVQEQRADKGELGKRAYYQTILDRVTVTKEGARQMRAYREGHIVTFNCTLRVQGIERGERGRVIEHDGKTVQLEMQDGRVHSFEPSRLPYNLQYDAVSVFAEKQIALHTGDPIRWTTNDHERGLANSDMAKVESVNKNGISVSNKDGEVIGLKHGDPMLERLDLAYAVNAHIAQGMTAKDGIMVLSENEKMLNSARGFLVAATRFTGEATLIVDNARNIERSVTRNSGDKTSAMEITGDDGKATEQYPGFREDLKKLSEKLGSDYAMAVLQNRERDITLEKPLGRDGEPQRDKSESERETARARDFDRGR